MPLRVANTVEKNVVSVPTNPITIPAATSIDVLPSIIGLAGEWVGRYIQVVGANDCYYAIGHDCDTTNYNGILASNGSEKSGQQFDASNVGQRISVYSVGGSKIAVTLLKRNDLDTHVNIR